MRGSVTETKCRVRSLEAVRLFLRGSSALPEIVQVRTVERNPGKNQENAKITFGRL